MSDVLVLGGGPAGLLTAVMLAAEGRGVTVLESDPPPPRRDGAALYGGWKRPGVRQFLQAHLLLPGGFRVLMAERPAVVDRMLDLGALRHNIIAGAWHVGATGGPQPGDDRFETVAARRPVLEAALLAEAEHTPGVTVRRGVKVTGLRTKQARTDRCRHVTGVLCEGSEQLDSDLVVDASGRRASGAAMLSDLGLAPHEQRADSGFRYYTRFFRSGDGLAQPPPPWVGFQHDSVAILILPGDHGTWSVTIATSDRDQELRRLSNKDTWHRAMRLYPTESPWAEGEPVTEVIATGGVRSAHRRLVVDDAPVVTGLVAVGDAWATTNPLFGAGMTTAFRHAALLRDTLRRVGSVDATAWSVAFAAATEHHLLPLWHGLDGWDRHRLAEIDHEMKGERYAADDPAWQRRIALEAARFQDPEIMRALAEMTALLAGPEVLTTPRLKGRVAALSTNAPRYPTPGPSRRELLSALADA
ncbi:NAD(P)/FAD-dependent oxidoreductase [Streptomyces sp. NPDC059861]|uniref:NAD(P)/FAD-dependent oxidoreductase n=1 Tax=Streptomyces sp. NPDC059861 TaxID=3346974 RepID=UPI0036667AC8